MTRYAITLLMLLCTAFLHGLIGHVQANVAEADSLPELRRQVPSQILQFSQAQPDMPVPESVRKNLETNTILMRTYASSSGRPVRLAIVYAEKTRRSLHFPEVCFTGQGWETYGKSAIPVGVHFVGQGLSVQKGDAREAVLYWFKTDRNLTGSYFLNSYYWSRDKLLLRSPSTMLVRLSTPIGSEGEAYAYRILTDFAAGLAPVLLENIP